MKKPCRKRAYGSEGAALRAHSAAGFTVRPYQCDRCREWHVANHDKSRGFVQTPAGRQRRGPPPRPKVTDPAKVAELFKNKGEK